jgi:pimeloyl-ACP methyl ester carboxylesterase
MARNEMPDVMVLLPGITGSVLKKNGKVVWGYSATTIGKALFTIGASMEEALALPHDDPVVDDLGDGVVPEARMPDLHLLPGIWKIDGYTKIADAIKANFEVTEGQNFFAFPYDWRRDNRVSARRLAQAAHGWLAAWHQSSGNADAKLILIGHSMGGLVSRYFLECLEGWKVTKALVTFGTPYRGSLNALDGLANGVKKGPLDLSKWARQLTGLYQLLPIYECYDAGDGKLVRVGETAGIPNVDPVKAAAALAFYREIEEAVTSNQKLPEYHAAGYSIYPVVGVTQQTELSARLVAGRVEMLKTYKGEALGGDGTVPRVSAIPIELSGNPSSAIYVGTQHGSLQNADPVIINLTGLLSGFALDLGTFRKPKTRVALEVEDVFFAGEPIAVRARPSNGDVLLDATLWRSGETRPVAVAAMQPASAWYVAEFAPQRVGAYRVSVTGTDVEDAEDSFVVAEIGDQA